MFALDSLVRNAVQQAVNILSPESGVQIEAENLEFPPLLEDAATSSSAMPKNLQPEDAHNLLTSPVIHVRRPSASLTSNLDLHKSLLVVQNFVKNLAFQLDMRATESS